MSAAILCAESATDRVTVSRLLAVASREQVDATRVRIARCRRALGRRRMICGGADGDLADLVRRRLRDGSLRAATWRCWPSARAVGRPCVVCGRPILEPDVEYVVAAAPLQYVHGICHDVWTRESVSFRATEPLRLNQAVSLRFDPSTVGRVMATVEPGWVYVLWTERPGHDGAVTEERKENLTVAANPPREREDDTHPQGGPRPSVGL
jgi:hypothetical protein